MDENNQLSAGDIIGNYRVVRKIGAGGMGEIYEAWEPELNRRVALKIIAKRAMENENVVERFKAEGRALAKLNNPHIVSVYVLGTVEDRPFIAMEYIEGLPLQEFLVLHPLGIRDLVDIFRQIVTGLGAAHAAGIIHRDIKPPNILIDEKFNAKLIDFGIAKVYSDQASLHTSANIFMGTVNYSAPEILKGQVATSKSDLFALGLVLYFMMTGETPFSGSSQLEVMENVRTKEITFEKHLGLYFPEELKAIVLKMTAKNPADRYESADQVLADLKLVPYDELPPELNVSSHLNLEITNKDEIHAECKKEGFGESEIRFIINIASDIEAKKTSVKEDTSDKTVSIELKRSISISKGSLTEAIIRFRTARSRLITKQISREQVTRQTTQKVLVQPQTKSYGSWVAVGSLLVVAAGLITYTVFRGQKVSMPEYRPGQVEKIRKRRFHKPDPTYQNTSIDTITVLSVKDGHVIMKNALGDQIDRPQNPFLPSFHESSTFDSDNHWQESNTIFGDTTAFFPLKVGKKSENRVAGNRKSDNNPHATNVNRTYEYKYTCEVLLREVVKIDIGERDTYKVKCTAVGTFNNEIIYNYDIKLRRVVLLQQDGIDPYFEELIYFKP